MEMDTELATLRERCECILSVTLEMLKEADSQLAASCRQLDLARMQAREKPEDEPRGGEAESGMGAAYQPAFQLHLKS